MRIRLGELLLATTLLAGPASAGHAQQRAPTPRELIEFTDVAEVLLAPMGNEFLVRTVRADISENRRETAVWRLSTRAGQPPQRLALKPGAHSPAWVPRGGGISFIVPAADGGTQLFVENAVGAELRQITRHAGGILSYAWSPDGRFVAYTALGAGDAFDDARGGAERGVVVSVWDFVFYRLFGNADFESTSRAVELWVQPVNGPATRINAAGSVDEFAWAPSGARIALTISPETGLGARRSDLMLYDYAAARTLPLLLGSERDEPGEPVSFSQPVWSPDGKKLAFLRQSAGDDGPALCTYAIATQRVQSLTDPDTLDLYRPRVWWPSADTMIVEMHLRGRRGLFTLSRTGSFRPIVYGDEERSGFTFSADYRQAVWIQQATNSPPEVYAGPWPFTSRIPITRFNAQLDSVWLPRAEAVAWRGSDGTLIHGLLLEPRDYEDGRRYPLITLVHGGPVFAVVNRFQIYPPWPYIGQYFAARGYAVFYPNYRGTGSYGTAFRRPDAEDAEPIDDILSGVQHLIATGLADSMKLGIIGQSHGAWIGPKAVIRQPLFRAASFAEGMVDYLSAYSLVPGWHKLRSYEPETGSPYENTARYLDLSTMLHLGATKTPTLIEVGQQSLALEGLKYASALWRHAIPHELVIYPRTGHNISAPALLLNSVERNTDWLDYWILGRRNGEGSEQQKQYQRWDQMKAGEGFPPPLKSGSSSVQR